MKLSIISVKGGIGKSTVAVSLSKELAKLQRSVLLLDMDLSGYTSYLGGIDGNGLFSSIVDDTIDGNFVRDIENIRVAKLAGDGPRVKIDASKIKDSDVNTSKFREKYSQMLSKGFDYVIVDNPPLSSPMDDGTLLERMVFSEIRRDYCYNVLVTDSNDFDLVESLRYLAWLRKVDEQCAPLALVVNMIPSKEKKLYIEKKIDTILLDTDMRIGVLVPFIEELFEYNGSLEEMPRLEQFMKLAKFLNEAVPGNNIIISY